MCNINRLLNKVKKVFPNAHYVPSNDPDIEDDAINCDKNTAIQLCEDGDFNISYEHSDGTFTIIPCNTQKQLITKLETLEFIVL